MLLGPIFNTCKGRRQSEVWQLNYRATIVRAMLHKTPKSYNRYSSR